MQENLISSVIFFCAKGEIYYILQMGKCNNGLRKVLLGVSTICANVMEVTTRLVTTEGVRRVNKDDDGVILVTGMLGLTPKSFTPGTRFP